MKKTLAILAFLAVTLTVSCTKETLVEPAVQSQSCPTVDSVDVAVFLVDYGVEYRYYPAAPATNTNQFVNPYVVTKSQGVTLDSVGLDVIATIATIDTTFSFETMLGGGGYPTEITALKIDKCHETTMEVWSGGTKLAVFYLAKTGFYDLSEAGCNANASSQMCPTNVNLPGERFKVMTKM